MSSSPTPRLPPYSSTPIASATSSSSSLPTASPAAAAGTQIHRKTVRFQTGSHDSNKNKTKHGLSHQQQHNGGGGGSGSSSSSSSSFGTGSSQITAAAAAAAALPTPPVSNQRTWYAGLPVERAGSSGANGGLHGAATASLAGAGYSLSQAPLGGNGSGRHGGKHRSNSTSSNSGGGGGGGSGGSGSGLGQSGSPPSYAEIDAERISSGGGGGGGGGSGHNNDDGQVARPSLLQPRVAVVLGLPSLWHLPLFACRSLSVCPAIWWSLGIFIRLLAQLHSLALARGWFGGPDAKGGGIGSSGFGSVPGVGSLAAAASSSLGSFPDRGSGLSLESRLKLTETALAMIWVSFLFLFFFGKFYYSTLVSN